MLCSVRLNECCRGEKTIPTMTCFLFNGAPVERAGLEVLVTQPSGNTH
jgi:hypothetical protein